MGTGSRRETEVFISYARASSGEVARALVRALDDDGVSVFLDTREENIGESISDQIREALLRSRVAVVFADATYFTRRYCAEELAIVLWAYRALAHRSAGHADLEEAVLPLIVALPASDGSLELELLPPDVRSTAWPRANQSRELAALTRLRVGQVSLTFGERLERLGELADLQERLHETIPVPKRLAGVPVYHEAGLPPSLGDGFVGRSRELWELHTVLAVQDGAAAALTAALEGGGGFGKTRLALEYLHRYGPAYPGGLFWVNAEVPEDRLEAQHHGILRLLKPGVPALAAFKASGRQLATELAEALQEVAGGRVLYVVDNVPEPHGGERPQPLHRWCPAPSQVSLLLTSRARTLVGGTRRLEVRELSASDASRLLLHEYGGRSALPDEAWLHVAAWVGEWPLALELLNAALRLSAVSPRELLALAASGASTRELERQMRAVRGAVPEGTLRGITEALGVSYQRLTDDLRSAARRLARLGPSPIPVALVAGWEPSIRVQLKARSFVCDVRSGEVEMFGRMHRVLADYLRGVGGEQDLEVRAVCDTLLGVMEWHACANPAHWPLMNACRPHAEAVIEREAPGATDTELVERLVHLHRMVSRLLRKQGQSAAAEQHLLDGLALALRQLGEEHATTLRAMRQLAWMLRRKGELEDARRLQERMLAASRRSRGEEHGLTLSAMRNLALTLTDLGEAELDHARELQERVWEGERQLMGPEHPETLTSLADLAATLRRMGEADRALALEEQMPEGWWRWLGFEYVNSLTALRNLATTMRARGEIERARNLQERLLEARRRLHGNEHPDTLIELAELAGTLLAQNESDRARELQEQVLAAMRRVLGERHPHTLRAVIDLQATSGSS